MNQDQDALRKRVERLQDELRLAQRELQQTANFAHAQRSSGTLSPMRSQRAAPSVAVSPARLAPLPRNQVSPPPGQSGPALSGSEATVALSAVQLHMLKETKRAVAIIEGLMQPRRALRKLPTLIKEAPVLVQLPPPPLAPEVDAASLAPKDANDAVAQRRRKLREDPSAARRETVLSDGGRQPLVIHLRDADAAPTTNAMAPPPNFAETPVVVSPPAEQRVSILRRPDCSDAAAQQRQRESEAIARLHSKAKSIGFDDARVVVTAVQAQLRARLSARVAQSLLPCLQPLVDAHVARLSNEVRAHFAVAPHSVSHSALLRGCVMLRAVQKYGLDVEVKLIKVQRHVAAAISRALVHARSVAEADRVARFIRELENDL